jgi:Cysteine rich repeat
LAELEGQPHQKLATTLALTVGQDAFLARLVGHDSLASEEVDMRSVPKMVLMSVSVAVPAMLFTPLANLHLPAFAQGGPCAADVQKLCQGVPRGRDNIMRCLKEHLSQLSAGCQERIQAAELGHACQSEVQQLCQNVKRSGSRALECLQDHESQLSDACKAELSQARSRRRPSR